MKERRTCRRWDCYLPCLCDTGSGRFRGTFLKMSLGGASISASRESLNIGEELTITFGPGAVNVSLPARIVWMGRRESAPDCSHFGVRFLDRLSKRRMKLADLLPEP
jgi:hypothetical protein